MRKGWLIAIVLGMFTAGAGTAGAAYYYGKDDRLPQGTAVGGLQVGGQSAALALDQIRSRLAALENREVRVKKPGGDGSGLPARTLKQLGFQVKADEAVRALERYRDSSWWERAKWRFWGKQESTFTLSVNWDEAVLGRELRSAWNRTIGLEPRDAKRSINASDEVVYTPEVIGEKVDLAELAARVRKIAPSSLTEPDSRRTGTITLPIVQKMPRITVALLKEQGIVRKISEFTTSFATSAEGRSYNVTAAAMALNDTLLQPGEIFEYGKTVDKAGKRYGYREAPVILKGKLTPGVGGGICQVSSTLYNAILRAGLDVVERRNHSLAVSYLPPGLDATYADGYVNFRFRNSTGKQLLIRTSVYRKRVTVKLFGTLPENVAYRTETKQLEVIPPLTKYVGNDQMAPGQQKVLQKGANGYVIDTYRIKLVNGKEMERVKMPRSHYKPQEELIAVHPDDSRLEPQDTTPPNPAQDGPVEPM